MSKPGDIPQDVWDRAEVLAKEATREAMRDPLMPYFFTVRPYIARAIMAERKSGDEVASVLKDILEALQRDAPGTPLNNHKYDQLGIRAYDAIRKRGEG